MQRVTTMTWVGLAINFVAVIMLIAGIIEESYYGLDNFDVGIIAFTAVFFTLQLIGVLMLAAGSPTGGTVAAVGSAAFVPIGLICLMGAMTSRNNLKKAVSGYNYFDDGAAEQGPRDVPMRSSAKTMYSPTLSVHLEPQGQTDSAGHRSAAGNEAFAAQSAAFDGNSNANSAAPAVAGSALAAAGGRGAPHYFSFADYRLMYGLLIAACVVLCIVMLPYIGDRAFRATLPATVIGIVFIIAYSRVANLPVLALYGDYMECMSSLYSSPVRVRYASIIGAELGLSRGKIYYKNADGGTAAARIAFGFIKGSERKEAKHQFKEKMTQLGVFKD